MKDPLLRKQDPNHNKGTNNAKGQSRRDNEIVGNIKSNKDKKTLFESLPTNGVTENWTNMHEAGLPISVMKSLFKASIESTEDVEVEKLREKQFSKVLELSPAMIIITDRWGEFEYANPMFLETVGYSREEVIGRGPGFLSSDITSSDRFYELEEAILKGTTWKGELIKRKKNGTKFIFSASLSPVENDEGFITNFIIMGQDITSFRETQEKLKNALEEKNVLLSELHHRVKNNLAVVSGMMQLQAFNENDDNLKSKLFSSAGRIKAMATMHELLYESKSLNRISFDQVIGRIVQHVSGVHKNEVKVELKWDLDEVELNVNQAHPCTLIMYEVISNAYKHAFKSLENGKIEIQMHSLNDEIIISIRDNGIGMKKNYLELGKQKSSTGYQLLNSLLKQLRANYRYFSDDTGTRFLLNFKKENIRGISNANIN